MTAPQIQDLVAQGRYPGEKAPVDLVETHISWVILTPEYAFKIKKPLRFPFLDFSTLDKREFYCQEELRLNRRLAPQMYLGVVPIGTNAEGQPAIGETGGEILDFVVQMKRMDRQQQMDLVLQRNEATVADMVALSSLLAPFHRSVVLAPANVPWKPGENRADFDDLFRMEAVAGLLFGPQASDHMNTWRKQVHEFLDRHESRLHERAASGFWIDGHGDLHARNIFLLPEGPLVFDCIEFNPHFRQIDVLSELAFLCMDLDAAGHSELAGAFMEAYLREWRVIACEEDESLFTYFKAYRANVRLKVALMAWEQHKSDAAEQSAKMYWTLLTDYLVQLLKKPEPGS